MDDIIIYYMAGSIIISYGAFDLNKSIEILMKLTSK